MSKNINEFEAQKLEALKKLNIILENQKKFCEYACRLKFIEHYHIDEHTVTFSKQGKYE